jgi:D-glycero-alpha-D-manno-heptose-7-phosphate kinase
MFPRSNADLSLVTTATPQRVSFVGGGTDFKEFYTKHRGAVVSTAINKFIYVTVKRHSSLFNEQYRLSYFKSEHVQKLDDIENAIARECLRLVMVEGPLFISTIADIPASSGLGSSSSFAVGLLNALHVLRGEKVSTAQLAAEACQVEIDVLKQPIGKQDQYAAAFGGLNYLRFDMDDRVTIDHLWVDAAGLANLFAHSMLFWTGVQREASSILTSQKANIDSRTQQLCEMRDQAAECRRIFLNDFDPIAFAKLLNDGWRLKQSLAENITNERIQLAYDQALKAGALGGKLVGAGGGGFIYLVVPPSRHSAVRSTLSNMTEVEMSYEPRGTRVLTHFP